MLTALKNHSVEDSLTISTSHAGDTGGRVVGPGIIRQADGSVMIYPSIPGGILTAEQLGRIGELAGAGKGYVKISMGQMLGILTTPDRVEETLESLASVGLYPAPLGTRVRTVRSCSGLLCPNAKQDAVGDAMKLNILFAGRETPRPFRMSVSACRNSCAESMLQDVGFIGTPGGYNVYIGGKAGGTPVIGTLVAKGVGAGQMPSIVETVLAVYQREATEREQLYKVIARLGIEVFETAINGVLNNAQDKETE